MPFVEEPVHLSKSRLKSDLVAHNVALPPAASRKEVYVELHLQHIDQRNAADFSSDEEDQTRDVADKEEDREDAEVPDPSSLTDDDLKATLLSHGVKAGPIVASTRALYEKKLRKLLQPDEPERVTGAEEADLYSDSEEEEEEGNGKEEDEESGSEEEKQETAEQLDQTQQESSQAHLHYQTGAFAYPQCFLPSSRLHPYRNRDRSSKRNSRNALKSSERSQSHCSQIPGGISWASSIDQPSGLGSGVPSGSQSIMAKGCASVSTQTFSITQMVEEMESRSSLSTSTDAERELNGSNVQENWSQSNRLDTPIVDKMRNRSLYYTPRASPHKRGREEPVKGILKDIFPDTKTTPTGIYATCRRPIKGAAQRRVQYAYPDTPVSSTTFERQQVERQLVPIHIRILVFLFVASVLYFIYLGFNKTHYDGGFWLQDSAQK